MRGHERLTDFSNGLSISYKGYYLNFIMPATCPKHHIILYSACYFGGQSALILFRIAGKRSTDYCEIYKFFAHNYLNAGPPIYYQFIDILYDLEDSNPQPAIEVIALSS